MIKIDLFKQNILEKSAGINLEASLCFFAAFPAHLHFLFTFFAHTQMPACFQNKIAQLLMASTTNP
jgi:hypothetical protein